MVEKNKPVKIVHWNANGIRDKLAELTDFAFRFEVDIILINETKLLKSDKCHINNFKCYRKDRESKNREGGGALFIRNGISHSELPVQTEDIEAHAIRLNDNNIIIVSCYNPPQTNINRNDLYRIFSLNNKVIAIGDLNSKHPQWHCKQTNINDRILYNYMLEHNINIEFTDNYTLYPYNGTLPSNVDILINKNVQNITKPITINELDSDHLPILVTINDKTIKRSYPKYLDYKNANWSSFRTNINNNLEINSKLTQTPDIDNTVNKLTQIIQNSIKKSIPTKKFNKTCP